MPSRRELVRRPAVGVAVTTALSAGALAWSSTLLGEYSVMDMGAGHGGSVGHAGHGGGASGAAAASAGTGAGSGSGDQVDVTSLTADPDRPADVRVTINGAAGNRPE